MNGMIKTIADIHPEQIYVTSKQYNAIKYNKHNKPFKIKDESIAQQLILLSLIKKEEIRIHREHEDDEDGWNPIIEQTGKYLLTPEGEYYLDYRRNNDRNHLLNEIRAWVTLAIAILGLVLSVYSIYLNQIANVK